MIRYYDVSLQRNKRHDNIELINIRPMATTFKTQLSSIMRMAWMFVKKYGFSMSEALKQAWLNAKLKKELSKRIVKFYFQKINGEIREAWGTLASDKIPAIAGTDNRKKNDSVQTYYDTVKEEWRCFKIANLIRIA